MRVAIAEKMESGEGQGVEGEALLDKASQNMRGIVWGGRISGERVWAEGKVSQRFDARARTVEAEQFDGEGFKGAWRGEE